MKISLWRNQYDAFTNAASASARQLSFAGIAFLWIFRSGDNGHVSLPDALFIPAALLILSLTLDLLQYVSGSLIWGYFSRSQELVHGPENDADVTAPRHYTWPINAFFVGKLLCVGAAYLLLLGYANSSIEWGAV